ncbi:MAG: hypothetical protein GY868_08345, partial [Deltaproteobacteria bacterium]|nr:hypothetical protein [Deltaproteobacteria bacterium]
PGEHVCLWLSYQNAPAGTYLDLKWYNNNVLIFEDQQELSGSSCYWTCRTINSPGSWKVEGFQGGVLQLAANFTVSGNRADCPLEKLPGGNNLEIDTVRRFRDQVLMRSSGGRKLVELYYNNSTALDIMLQSSPFLRQATLGTMKVLIPAMRLMLINQGM